MSDKKRCASWNHGFVLIFKLRPAVLLIEYISLKRIKIAYSWTYSNSVQMFKKITRYNKKNTHQKDTIIINDKNKAELPRKSLGWRRCWDFRWVYIICCVVIKFMYVIIAKLLLTYINCVVFTFQRSIFINQSWWLTGIYLLE